ncbi:hypothetical protein [Thiolapillus sp.]|uniref:hypothetical protein n=1 Tax=Thiolapillus sp. TaxID=2017437 RepID=UPI003AF6699D
MKSDLVDQAVETLCLKGCKALWADLERMEEGRVLPELEALEALEALDAHQQQQVFKEIKSIMAVYKGSCSLEKVAAVWTR